MNQNKCIFINTGKMNLFVIEYILHKVKDEQCVFMGGGALWYGNRTLYKAF